MNNSNKPDQIPKEVVDKSIVDLNDDMMRHDIGDMYDEQMEGLRKEYIEGNQVKFERWPATLYFIFEWFRDKQYDNIEEYANRNAEFGDRQEFSYADKLKYVEHVGRCYYVGFHEFCLEATFFTIKPNGLNEQVAYNRWVIDNWRFWLHSGKKIIGENDFPEVYGHIDELLKGYAENTVNLRKKEKIAYINKELGAVKSFIKRAKVSDRLIETMLVKFKANRETHIYHQEVDTSSMWNDLNDIAQVWDMLKYQVFLDDEIKRSTKVAGVDEAYRPVPLKMLNDDQISLLYKRLIDECFIDRSCNYIKFKHALLQKESDDVAKIRWIDPADSNYINKVTLIELIDRIIEDEGTAADRNSFIVRYFNTYIANVDQDIFRKDLNQSKKRVKKQKAPTDRQITIFHISDAVLNLK
ncbi:MAG: hypothetical protein WC623_00865 [Pedobacter sp.]|uniref:hypothetical protein n=1 Tax=Pedobacter sp. TaxID=1411316 RepID=UPI0035692692